MTCWSRAEIIRQILRREAEGRPLSLGGDSPVDQTLYQAAARIFGSWRNAVSAAGISTQKSRAHGTRSPMRILAGIRSLARRRRPPRPHELQRLHGALMRAARRVFGSWSAAVTAAGVDPLKLRSSPPWTRDRVIEAILMRALRNESLRSRSVNPRSLPPAGIRLFGSWAAALAAAGLNPSQHLPSIASPESRHPRAETIAIANGTERAGTRLSHSNSRRPYPTPESVIQEIHARLDQRKPMNSGAVYDDDRPLYRAAERHFRNWRTALAAAGLDPQRFQAVRRRIRREPEKPDLRLNGET